ncbi:WLM domain-containing protein [Syncephalis pseudoplumigaleata]|uniref:WLM domain-containing protein n=1 Tax=Syncephalis pseudoplumigaleata TaxID=1712513 RepID=A0A4P9Z068_9FUNG|nr:WLM domain-containing protein [Syncephalis pseudoplumigaleata]|eukprot:RKP25081.1 WLM domain-containing protein [Syncephalis pseudoplumigaleata]
MTIAASAPLAIVERRALKRQPRYQEACELLDRLARQVEPLLVKYRWRVGLLREFLPTNHNLLGRAGGIVTYLMTTLGVNVNRGQEIRIRLRYASTPHRFISYESLLGTLLHE